MPVWDCYTPCMCSLASREGHLGTHIPLSLWGVRFDTPEALVAAVEAESDRLWCLSGVVVISPTEVMCVGDKIDAAMCMVTLPESVSVDGRPSLGRPCTVEQIHAPSDSFDIDEWSFQVVGSEVYAIPDSFEAEGDICVYVPETKDWRTLSGFMHENGEICAATMFAIDQCVYVPVDDDTIGMSKLWRYTPETALWEALPFCPLVHDREDIGYFRVIVSSATTMYGTYNGTEMYSYTPGSSQEWQSLGACPDDLGDHLCTPVGPYLVYHRYDMDIPTVYDTISGEWVDTMRGIRALFGERGGAEYSMVVGAASRAFLINQAEIVCDDSAVYVSVLMVDTSIVQNRGGFCHD
ncbi:hypothetical protein KIPB_003114 [Kipferlia bialata]|uniref:Uncharacterized protein n=1 Tax=Kipferlia bialata TaxID=797122 RepID=A0A9K3CSW5_9EUKA|nr:hypothetical protein KIPB_003114 [Kipferlia bialata]|eukprot:g3114.t1